MISNTYEALREILYQKEPGVLGLIKSAVNYFLDYNEENHLNASVEIFEESPVQSEKTIDQVVKNNI